MAINRKPQILAIFKHEDRKLAYVSMINQSNMEIEATVAKQYSRARSVHKAIINNLRPECGSGFMYALINTDCEGWTVEIVKEVFGDAARASAYRQHLIWDLIERGYTYVGSEISAAKGTIGEGKDVARWNEKFKVANMTKAKIYDKISFLFASSDKPIEQKEANAVYMAIACPDTHGPRNKNYGSYAVDSLSNMFMFIRNYRGLDLVQ